MIIVENNVPQGSNTAASQSVKLCKTQPQGLLTSSEGSEYTTYGAEGKERDEAMVTVSPLDQPVLNTVS